MKPPYPHPLIAREGWLFVAIGLVPMMVAFLSFAHGLESSTSVQACGSCHVMTPFVADLHNVNSDTLAATHFKNRYIQERQCYTCHSDYGLSGTIRAKFDLPTGVTAPQSYVYHCHIVEHEDNDMMRPFTVSP